jgi:hypothetical protein
MRRASSIVSSVAEASHGFPTDCHEVSVCLHSVAGLLVWVPVQAVNDYDIQTTMPLDVTNAQIYRHNTSGRGLSHTLLTKGMSTLIQLLIRSSTIFKAGLTQQHTEYLKYESRPCPRIIVTQASDPIRKTLNLILIGYT